MKGSKLLSMRCSTVSKCGGSGVDGVKGGGLVRRELGGEKAGACACCTRTRMQHA